MSEVTHADRDAAEEWRLDMDPGMRSLLAAAFARHREQAAAEERAKIVAWLGNAVPGSLGDEDDIADAIAEKEHLK